jgi:large subunit ribosomal protein L28|tara:strand:+ start:237 stop:782 length:546 start_codon:yes stop_codon:yes gene_type:complete
MSSGKKALTSKLLHATMTMMRGGGGQQQQQQKELVKKVVVCGRAKRGLYHGKTVRFGNNVSEDGGNKTRRKWSPNAKRKRLYSEVLNRMVPMQVTAHALKCIDKAGGLDNYVLNTPVAKMMSLKGMELKEKMTRALSEERRRRGEEEGAKEDSNEAEGEEEEEGETKTPKRPPPPRPKTKS